MRKSYDIEISGSAEPRRVRAEITGAEGILARSAWITLGAGQRRTVQVTVEAPPGVYSVWQKTNLGSNVHEDHTIISLGEIDHGEGVPDQSSHSGGLGD